MRRVYLAVMMLVISALMLAGLPGYAPSQHAHAVDPNDHYEHMYAGGVPGQADPLPMVPFVDCTDGDECLVAAGLGLNNANRSYPEEKPAMQHVYASTDGIPDGPFKGWPSCIPDHKDTTEIGPFLHLSFQIQQQHNYGPPVAVGPRGPPATMACARVHFQTAGNFIGRQVNQVGIDGTGRRSPVAEIHHVTFNVPNPCYGKPCAGPYIGRYLVGAFRALVMEIAPSASQSPRLNPAQYKVVIVSGSEAGQEVWYLANFTPDGDKGHIEGHHIGQNRVPFSSVLFRRADGTTERGIVAPGDGVYTWNTCGTRYDRRRDPGIPCVKTTIPAGAYGGYKGRTVQNPNESPIPQDWLGNRLLPLSYHWVKCLPDQEQLVMPVTRDGDGNWLNPHQIVPALPARVIPYQPPECAYTLDIEAATEFPAAGLKGTANDAPAPEPTGEPVVTSTPTPVIDTPTPEATSTSTPTPEHTPTVIDTPTQEPAPTPTNVPASWRSTVPANVIHWWKTDQYHVEDKPPPDFIDEITTGVDWQFGDGPPREGLPDDDWSAVFYGTWQGGAFQGIRFRCDDDCRIVVNDVVEHDGTAFSSSERQVTHADDSPVPVRVELHDTGGDAYVRVEFLRPPTATATP